MVKNKIILITGASSGFGKLTVPLLLKHGHTVLTGIRGGQSRLTTLFPNELKTHSNRLFAVDLHLEHPDCFSHVQDFIAENFQGKLDVLINNAGYGLLGAIEDQTPEQIRHQFEVNFFGPLLLIQTLLPSLKASKGRILNVSSIAGLMSFPFYGSYNASKYALEAMSEAFYYDLKPFGIQVGLIEPGGFKTEFATSSMKLGERAKNPSSPNYRRTVLFEKILKERSSLTGNPVWVAKKIVHLTEKNHVPIRTLVGLDAHFLSFIRRIAPESWRVKAEELICRKFIFKE